MIPVWWLFLQTTVRYDVPPGAESAGTCGKSINLTWTSKDGRATMVLSMAFKDSSNKWSSSSVALNANSLNGTTPLVDGGVLKTLAAVNKKPDELSVRAKAGHSYKCMKTKTHQLGNAVQVSFMKIQVQPSGETFGEGMWLSMIGCKNLLECRLLVYTASDVWMAAESWGRRGRGARGREEGGGRFRGREEQGMEGKGGGGGRGEGQRDDQQGCQPISAHTSCHFLPLLPFYQN